MNHKFNITKITPPASSNPLPVQYYAECSNCGVRGTKVYQSNQAVGQAIRLHGHTCNFQTFEKMEVMVAPSLPFFMN